MTSVKKIPISFKNSQLDLYSYLKTKRNISCYIKDLLEIGMNKSKQSCIEVVNGNVCYNKEMVCVNMYIVTLVLLGTKECREALEQKYANAMAKIIADMLSDEELKKLVWILETK